MSEILFHGGSILTQDVAHPRVESVLVRGGRIVAAGRLVDVEHGAERAARRIDLGGRTLIPAFRDAHIHVWKVGHLLTSMLDLRGVASLAELANRLRTAAERLPAGAWLVGRGFNEAVLAERRRPTRADLDAAVPGHPVYLIRTCAHIAVANSRALHLAEVGASTAAPGGGTIVRDAHGEPTGELHETALGLVARAIPEPSSHELSLMIAAASRELLRHGVASATDPGVLPGVMQVYRNLDAEGALPLRLRVMSIRRPDGGNGALPLPEVTRSERLTVDTIKLFADGGLSGATAALSQRYRHAPERGVLRLDEEELVALASDAVRAGLGVSVHAIGDVALDATVGAYERLAALQAAPMRRLRIEHVGLPSADHLRRMARGGFAAVPQAIFLKELGANFLNVLPDDFVPRCYPLRAVLDAGVAMALSSDAPVVRSIDPLAGMAAAIDRRASDGRAIAPEQAVTAEEALWAYTRGSALAEDATSEEGCLRAGAPADLTILSGDPLKTPPERLTALRVDAVYVGGELAFER